MYIALYILAGILALLFFLMLIAPKTYNVSRSIEINSPKETVFDHLKYLSKQQEWSPWAKKDPNMETKMTGTDGTVGAVHSWVGNKDVGDGEQEITKIEEGKRVEGELRFFKPWKSISDCYMDLEETQNGNSKVTWGFSGNNKFPMNIMSLFMSMDKMVGPDFEAGLKNLKTMLEK